MSSKKATQPKKSQKAPKTVGKAKKPAAPVAVGVKVTGVAGRSIRDQGTDQLDSISISTDARGVAAQFVVTPGLLKRLGRLAGSFQRIKYHRLRFEVVTGCPSSSSGVYVTGFIRDATDQVDSSSAVATLLASGGTAVKFWQSTEVVVNGLPDLYYTSASSRELRWSSPGSFVIAVVAPPSSAVTIEVFVHWDVTLSKPTYEAGDKSSTDGFHTAEFDMSTSTGNAYLSRRTSSGWAPVLITDFTPELETGKTYSLSSFRFGSVQNASSVLNGLFGFCHIYADTSRVYPVDDLSKKTSEKFFDEVWVVRKGESVSEVTQSKNFQRAPWFRSTMQQSRNLPDKYREIFSSNSSRSNIEHQPGSHPLSSQQLSTSGQTSSSSPSGVRCQTTPGMSPLLLQSEITSALSPLILEMFSRLGITSPSQVSSMACPVRLPDTSPGSPFEILSEEDG